VNFRINTPAGASIVRFIEELEERPFYFEDFWQMYGWA